MSGAGLLGLSCTGLVVEFVGGNSVPWTRLAICFLLHLNERVWSILSGG